MTPIHVLRSRSLHLLLLADVLWQTALVDALAPVTNTSASYGVLPLQVTLPAGAHMKKSSFFAVETCESGYTQLSRVSLTVSKGLSGRVDYSVSTRGVRAGYLSSLDKNFRYALTDEQLRRYNGMRWQYGGGLDVPFLRMVGVDLSRPRVGRREMQAAAHHMKNYGRLAWEARRIVNDMKDHDVSVKGSLTAVGITDSPITVFAFLRVAKVKRADGSSLMVLSDRPEDQIGVSDDGNIMGGNIPKGPLWWHWKPERCTF